MNRLRYRAFCLVSSLDAWIGRRFTPAGLIVLGGLVISAVLGIDTNQTVAYQAFTFLLALLAMAMLSAAFARPRCTASRVLPRFGTVGAELAYRIVVTNRTRRTQRGLLLRDTVPPAVPSFDAFLHTREPGGGRRNWFDRTVGYPRWSWLVADHRTADVREMPLGTMPAGEAIDVRAVVTPRRRGRLQFTGVAIARLDPFGLFKSWTTLPAAQSVLVLPTRYPVPPVALPGARKYQPGGVALASAVGESEEFVSVREYRPGDPLRRLHWKSWAKTGTPMVKEYQDEFFVRHALVLDTFGTVGSEDRFEEAVSVAASFACTIDTQESLLDLLFVGPERQCFTAGRGLGGTDKMLEILASVSLCRDKPFSVLHRSVVDHLSSASGCICVLLAWDDARRAFVRHLRTLGVPLLVLVVTDADVSAPLDQGPMSDQPECVHPLRVGAIAEGLAAL
ncbi:MAG: DUF58 domain-containing protein [Nitrospirae bacterium]|nr:DUF58 domain-containing protein [Nitrospirota bacterium]